VIIFEEVGGVADYPVIRRGEMQTHVSGIETIGKEAGGER